MAPSQVTVLNPIPTTSPRLFVPDALAEGAEIAATPAQAHYLGTVLRHGPGAPLRLFNGRDGEWGARLAAIRKDRATLVVETRTRLQAPEPDLWLVFAPLKRDATDLVVEKATELGAAALLPVFTERTNTARLNPDRLRAIATEAAEQCERLTVPHLAEPRRLADLLAGWPAGRRLVAALERADAPSPTPSAGPTALLVGPEGGFAPAEATLLLRHPAVRPVSLGPRVLRAETAAIVGLALLQFAAGSYEATPAGAPASD
jgi:16S rRNA (uracil1498-N3)-methyltransferase